MKADLRLVGMAAMGTNVERFFGFAGAAHRSQPWDILHERLWLCTWLLVEFLAHWLHCLVADHSATATDEYLSYRRGPSTFRNAAILSVAFGLPSDRSALLFWQQV